MKTSRSRIALRPLALSIFIVSVAWAASSQLEQKDETIEDNSAYAPCLNRRQEPAVIVDVCTQMIDAGAPSTETLAILHIERGYALDRINEWSRAVEDFDRAIDLDSKSFEAWQGKSIALDGLDEDIAALEAIEKSLALDPNQRYSVNRKFRILTKLERYQDADQYYSQLMEHYNVEQNSAMYWMPQELGRMRIGLQQYPEAAHVLRIAVLLKPDDKRSREYFFRSCRLSGAECPALTPEARQLRQLRQCDEVRLQVMDRHPDYWASLNPDFVSTDEETKKQSIEARIRISEAAFFSYASQIQQGEGIEDYAQDFILLEEFLACMVSSEIFDNTDSIEISAETNSTYGGKVRENLIDLAWMFSKETEREKKH